MRRQAHDVVHSPAAAQARGDRAIAAFIGLTVAIAVKAAWWWPFLVILAVTGFGYLLGLSSYGSGEPDAEEDADAGQQVQSPVQR